MIKLILSLILLLTPFISLAQPPQGISYQAVAYNPTTNLPIINQTISLRFSILDNSASGPAVYVETFTQDTNQEGIFSLNIGTGVQVTGSFSAINWGLNQKFLKVEMDTTGGTNYVLVGTSQLMSVPYALYSQSAGNNFQYIKNIEELRTLPVQLPNDVNKIVYIKGYYEEGDGGDGFFIFKEDETIPDLGGIHIKPNIINPIPSNGNGRWVRQYTGPINVIYFGVVKVIDQILYQPPNLGPNGDQTNGVRINNAIEYVNQYNLSYIHGNPLNTSLTKTPQDMTIYFPSGGYFIDKKINLYSEINIKGDRGTRFFPIFGKTGDYLFNISDGFIEKLNIENIEVDFSLSQNGLGGIHLFAKNIKNGGGTWISNFKNIKLFRPSGHGIFLEGEDDPKNIQSVKAWNQYLHFEDIYIERQNLNTNNSALRITGANVNIQFESCFFQIPYTTNVSSSDLGANIFISSSGLAPQIKPCNISFINCASGGGFNQGVYNGFKIENSENITIENCWFEDLEVAIDISNSKDINILNCRFANAAGLGGQNIPVSGEFGTCIFSRNSIVNVERNYVLVSNPNNKSINNHRFIRAIGENTINVNNNSFSDIRLSETYGIVQETFITSIPNYNTSSPYQMKSGIEIGEKKVVVVKIGNEGNVIDRINSSLNAGETLFIRAENGEIKINEWNPINETNGRNIYLSGDGNRSIILRHGQGAYFIKMDGINGIEKCAYQLVSITD